MKVEPWLRVKPDCASAGNRRPPWFKSSLRSSLFALLTSGRGPADEDAAAQEDRIDALRSSMLELIADMGGARSIQVARRIRYATDVQSLWFLRTDLMTVLSGSHGEAAARQTVEGLSAAYMDLLPKGLRSRISGFNRVARG